MSSLTPNRECRKMSKKVAMFSNGTAIVKEGETLRKASEQEVKDYLVSIVPQKKAGSDLQAVRFEDGFVYAKYASGKVFRKKIAQAETAKQTQPLDSADKAEPSVNVPRKKSKSNPEIDPGDKSVKNPTEVVKSTYEKGGNGSAKKNTTEVVPRSTSDGGLKGGKSVDFADIGKTESGTKNYVQKFTEGEKPTPAGNEKNHTAGTNIQFKSEAEIYQKLSTSSKEEDEDNLPPWLKGKKKDKKDEKSEEKNEKSEGDKADEDSEKKDEEKEAMQAELFTVQAQIKELKAEIDRFKVREARQKSALKLALAYRDLSPQKYSSVEAVAEKTMQLAKAMNVDALESQLEEVKSIQIDEFQKRLAAKEDESIADGKVAFAMNSTRETIMDGQDVESRLKDILIQSTSLGRKMAEFDSYVPHTKE